MEYNQDLPKGNPKYVAQSSTSQLHFSTETRHDIYPCHYNPLNDALRAASHISLTKFNIDILQTTSLLLRTQSPARPTRHHHLPALQQPTEPAGPRLP